MDKLIEEQVQKTKLLMTAVEITKASGNPRVEDLCVDIKNSLLKAEGLIEKRKELLSRKREMCYEMEEHTKKCIVMADKAETFNQDIFQGQSHEGSPVSDQCTSVNGQSLNTIEVSPCPSEWANGALFTPVLKERNIYQPPPKELPDYLIKSLHSKEFEDVPSYMKGRITCENVNSFIMTINSVLKKKYSIANLKRKDVKRKDIIHYCNWKSQEGEFKMTGHIFFTDEDLLNLGNVKIDKSADKMFQILRHTKRLRQSRVTRKIMLYILI